MRIGSIKNLKARINLLALLVLTGCIMPAQKGGHSSFQTPSGLSGNVAQSENPKTDSTQSLDRRVREFRPDGVVVLTEEKLNTKIGASQKDTAREMAAKLGSLKGVVWVGVLLFLFGAASAVYPPLKLIVGSLTTSVICAVAGLALIVLPTLIVGHELLILCVGVGVTVAWFFAHRHGELRGQVKKA